MALKDFEELIYYLEKKKVSDGLGGWINEWVKGMEFKGVFSKANTQEQQLATQKGLSEVWVLIVDNKIDLNPNDYIQYKDKYYRIITDELATPSKSKLNVHQYQAENVVKLP